jgi:hypothetical protein
MSASVHAALNELSLTLFDDTNDLDDLDLVGKLGVLVHNVHQCITRADRGRLRLAVPSTFETDVLPRKTATKAAVSQLKKSKPDLAKLLFLVLTSGPWFDDLQSTECIFQNSPANGLAHALALKALALSLDVSPWRASPIVVTTHGRTDRKHNVTNAWHAIDVPHRVVLAAKGLRVLPFYEDPGHHNPRRKTFVKTKSHLPGNAEHVLQHAIPEPTDVRTWWARCEHRFFHRFSGSKRDGWIVVHWNGTTNPNATEVTSEDDIPKVVRSELERSPVAEDCRCAQVGRR